MIWNTSEFSESHLSKATTIYVDGCCHFGPCLIFGLIMDLMACVTLVGITKDQSYHFTDLFWKYQWYDTLKNFLYLTSVVPQPCLLLITANFALTGFLGWKWSLWPVPPWLAVQQNKYVFFLIIYDSINDLKYFRTVCIPYQPCHSHFCCWLLPKWP